MLRTATAVLVSALVAAGVATTPAQASTGGTADSDGQHANVAFTLAYGIDGNRYRCSATLIHERVLLTAAHCADDFIVGKVLVSFAPAVGAGVAAEPPLPVAGTPSEGYTAEELGAAGYASGDAHFHPDYSYGADLKSWNDLGLVVLDDKVEDGEVAAIADVGTLDSIPTRSLSSTPFTAVGYGDRMVKPASGPRNAQPADEPMTRRFVTMPGQKVTAQLLQTQANVSGEKASGTTCHGDSGGPVLLDGELVAVTSFGINDKCQGIAGAQRVDIAGAQDWIEKLLATVPG